jgi:S-adenosyl-L-methionine hydrolase (adenosine-forming)
LNGPGPAGAGDAGATVFFLSDYGLADELVGVVHAVVRRLAPQTAVIDLSHGVAPFDVRAGAAALVRSVPHLGPGVVLAVVDPGVGGTRRGVVLDAAAGGGPRWFVGPDNGLLVEAAELGGGIRDAWALARPPGGPVTFDGRDVFAPAAARLSAGADAAALGRRLPAGELVRLRAPVFEPAAPGQRTVRAEVTWVDRYGNVQLAAPGSALPVPGPAAVTLRTPGAAPGGTAGSAGAGPPGAPAGGRPAMQARRVRAFADLAPGALGLLSDGNGRLALVVREGSAAERTGARPGDVVELTW